MFFEHTNVTTHKRKRIKKRSEMIAFFKFNYNIGIIIIISQMKNSHSPSLYNKTSLSSKITKANTKTALRSNHPHSPSARTTSF